MKRTGVTLITMAHANPIAFKRTIDSVKGVCNEIILGELCMFPEDTEVFREYRSHYNLRIRRFPFNYLYLNGFSECLNDLTCYASNNVVLYLNVGEVIDRATGDILANITDEYNAWYIDHATEKHRWWRCYDRRDLKWSGRIHEELIGDFRPYHKPIFTFADTDKDMGDKFKAWIANDVKEMVYWRQLMHLVDHPEELGATNAGWLKFAKDQYESMRSRMEMKGDRVTSFEKGDLEMYTISLMRSRNIISKPFESTDSIEFQGDPKFLNKK